MKHVIEEKIGTFIKTLMLLASDKDETGRSQNIVNFSYPLLKFLFEKYFRVSVNGLKKKKNKGPLILIANHSGTVPYDAAMIAFCVKKYFNRDLYFLADKFAFKLPLIGDILRLIGAVPATWDNAVEILKAGHPLLIFPEGVKGIGKPYSRRYRLNKFSSGFARLSKEFHAPILPVGVVGAEEIHPVVYREEKLAKMVGLPFIPITPTFPWLGPLGLIPLPTKWVISFGKILDPKLKVKVMMIDSKNQINSLISKGRIQRKTIWE